jgi:teichuronic acid biosynthesis glycosyltransferase TuaG
MDLISVIMPFYKKKDFFKDSLLSALDQTYKNLEIIIIYDDIMLEDLKFIQKLSKLDSRIKIIINERNFGAGTSRNIGISTSKGKFIAFLDCDDIWKKDKIKIQYDYMKDKNLVFSHTSYEIIDKSNSIIGLMKVSKERSYHDLLNSCDIGLSTVMMKKDLINIASFKNLKTKEDYALWLEYARNGIKIVGIKQVLASWRNLNNSLSSTFKDKFVNAFNVYYKFEKKGLLKSLFLVIKLSVFYMVKKIKQKNNIK